MKENITVSKSKNNPKNMDFLDLLRPSLGLSQRKNCSTKAGGPKSSSINSKLSKACFQVVKTIFNINIGPIIRKIACAQMKMDNFLCSFFSLTEICGEFTTGSVLTGFSGSLSDMRLILFEILKDQKMNSSLPDHHGIPLILFSVLKNSNISVFFVFS